MQYNNSEFKRLLINSSTTTKFIGGFGQLKALQEVWFIEIDKTTVKSTSFVFEFGNTFFIGIVNLNKSLQMIVFHIIQVNTLFLLCLVNINKLRTFFNNFIN